MEILRRNIILLIWMAFAFSCQQKEEPLPFTGEPEFYLIGSINGEEFSHSAGIDGFYMNTFSQVSSSQVLEYSGSFENVETGFSLDFFIPDVNNGSGTDSENSLAPGSIDFVMEKDTQFYEVTFNSGIVDSTDISVEWNFGDGIIGSQMNPTYRYQITQQDIEVCLKITYPNSCTEQICQIIRPFQDRVIDILVDSSNTVQSDVLRIFPDYKGLNIESQTWIIDGSTEVSTGEIVIQNDPANPVRTICLKAVSNSGDVYEKCIQVNTDRNNNDCTANFDFAYNTRTEAIFTEPEDRQVKSQFEFNSRLYFYNPSSDNYLIIRSSEPYLVNEKGEETQKISFEMKANYIDINGDELELIVSDGVIALSLGD